MIKDFVWFIVAGLGGGILFFFIQQLVGKKRDEVIKSQLVKTLVDTGVIKQDIADKISQITQKTTTQVENFDSSKLKEGLTTLTNKVSWAKAFVGDFNLRTILIRVGIICVLVGSIYGYGWYSGKQGVQPVLDLHGKEEWIKLNEHFLHVKPDGTMDIVDKDKTTILKKITIKDVQNLKNALRPYGFILEPIAVMGASLGGNGGSIDGGVGASVFKWYKAKLDLFIAYTGAYVGTSYSLSDHSGIGIAAGKGWKGDTRAMLYYKFRF